MMFGGGMLLGWLLPVLLLVLGGVWLFNNTSGRRDEGDNFTRRSQERSAAEILDERYARGEITQSEYQEMSEALRR